MLSFKMTTYHPYKVNLSEGQKDKLEKAIRSRNPISLRLKNSQLSGNDQAKTTLMLTANQIKKNSKSRISGKRCRDKSFKKSSAKNRWKSFFCPFSPGSIRCTNVSKNTWIVSVGWFGE